MFTWITKLGFAGVLSCLALLLSLVVTTGMASAHTQHAQVLDQPTASSSLRDTGPGTWTYGTYYVEDFREVDSYRGFSPKDPSNYHYILIDSWWQNNTGQGLYLDAPIFNLSASDGTAYYESDSNANPNSYQMYAYQRITITRAFIVDNSECNFTLTTPYDSSFLETIVSTYTDVCSSQQQS